MWSLAPLCSAYAGSSVCVSCPDSFLNDRRDREKAILTRIDLLQRENGFKRTTKRLQMVKFLLHLIYILVLSIVSFVS